MSSALQPVRSPGRCGAICSHLKRGNRRAGGPAPSATPSGRCRLWNQGASPAISRSREFVGGRPCDCEGIVHHHLDSGGREGVPRCSPNQPDDGLPAPPRVVPRCARRGRGVGHSAPMAPPPRLRGRAEVVQRLLGRSRDEDLLAGAEQLVEPVPAVADDRHAAGGGFEQPHAGAVAGADHVGARDVQGEALPVVERAVLRRAADARSARRWPARRSPSGYCGPATTKRPLRPAAGPARAAAAPAAAGGRRCRCPGSRGRQRPRSVLGVVQVRIDRAIERPAPCGEPYCRSSRSSVGPPVNERYSS